MKKLMVVLLIAFSANLSVSAANNDEWWEYTMQMDGMEGFSVPPQKDCYRKNQIAPSGGNDCTSSNMKQNGSKFSSDYSCKDGSSGRIEGSQTGSTSNVKITSKSPQGESMSMTSKGKKVGSCNWATDSSEAKACAGLNQSVASTKADLKKECESALKNDDFQAFLGGESTDASINLTGKKCGGNIASGCVEQRPKMCSKVQGYLKETSGNDNGFKKVMGGKSGVDLTKQCGLDTAMATKNFCSAKMKAAKDYQNDIVSFCEADAKALFAQHCAGRDYTAQSDSGYGTICRAYGKGGNAGRSYSGDSKNSGTSASGSNSSGTSGSSPSPSPSPGPGGGALEKAKKLKDLFGF